MEIKNTRLLVVKETEKAVAIENKLLKEAIETAKYDVKELTYEQKNELRNGTKLIWLPKSQIEIEDGYVVFMPDWLAQRNGIMTTTLQNAMFNRMAQGISRYEKALAFAKEHKLAVRNKMKLSTIIEKIRNAGLKFEF